MTWTWLLKFLPQTTNVMGYLAPFSVKKFGLLLKEVLQHIISNKNISEVTFWSRESLFKNKSPITFFLSCEAAIIRLKKLQKNHFLKLENKYCIIARVTLFSKGRNEHMYGILGQKTRKSNLSIADKILISISLTFVSHCYLDKSFASFSAVHHRFCWNFRGGLSHLSVKWCNVNFLCAIQYASAGEKLVGTVYCIFFTESQSETRQNMYVNIAHFS